jgi:hypothetical protein
MNTMKPKTKTPPAVMEIHDGEEIVGGWVTNAIPQIGVYKLLAKKKADGSIEWAHFVQRDNGLKEKVYRGAVPTVGDLHKVIDVINHALTQAYGMYGAKLSPADYDVSTLDGKKTPPVKL